MSYERPGPMPPGQPSAFGLNQIGRADEVRTPRPDEALSAITCRDERRISVEFLTLAVIAGLTLAWVGGTHLGADVPPPFGNAAVWEIVINATPTRSVNGPISFGRGPVLSTVSL